MKEGVQRQATKIIWQAVWTRHNWNINIQYKAIYPCTNHLARTQQGNRPNLKKGAFTQPFWSSYFLKTVINLWNSQPDEVVDSQNMILLTKWIYEQWKNTVGSFKPLPIKITEYTIANDAMNKLKVKETS